MALLGHGLPNLTSGYDFLLHSTLPSTCMQNATGFMVHILNGFIGFCFKESGLCSMARGFWLAWGE